MQWSVANKQYINGCCFVVRLMSIDQLEMYKRNADYINFWKMMSHGYIFSFYLSTLHISG